MNLRQNIHSLVCTLLLVGLSAHAYTAPTEGQLGKLLANPTLIRTVLDDATPQEAADLLVRILTKLEASDISPLQKQYLASYYAARITFLMGNKAGIFVDHLLPGIPASLRSATLSGVSVGGRGSSALMLHLRTIVASDPILLQAINDPKFSLGDSVYNQLIASLQGVQSLPPIVTDTLPPLSPPSPPGSGGTGNPPGGGPPPPVPEPYPGQQNPI